MLRSDVLRDTRSDLGFEVALKFEGVIAEGRRLSPPMDTRTTKRRREEMNHTESRK
jgi:hypothetical protein